MAPRDFQVDTTQMMATAQKTGTIADDMAAHAQVLKAGVEFARARWEGQAGAAFRTATDNQSQKLDQLIRKLQFISDVVKQSGQGFESQDADGRAKVGAQAQRFLDGSLNH